ncbi:hypothetical protein Tco_0874274 [Tanacetum coccineum]|uniref:Retrotransposon gag domain-containing protein n=1 Tax=Tanacetum coccineum TaxID=301880 RepID=A0ABQ5BP42_9ASTR
MSSPNHSTSDIEDTFSSMNILNYTSVSSDYLPALSVSTSFNSSENSKDNMIPPVFLPFYNNPCLKDVQAFYAKESPILSPDPITPPAILTVSPNQTYDLVSSFSVYTPTPPQIFEIGKSSIKIHLKHHEEQIEDILNYLEELSFHRIEKMEEGHINRIIIQRNNDELKTELKRVHYQIIKLQRKQLGQRDKIAFAYFRISDLEQIIEEIQAPLEAQAATMASASNPNRNTEPTRTLIAKMGNYKEFFNCQPFYFNVKKMEDEFYNLVVKGNDLKTYIRRFQELAVLCPNMVPNSEKLMEIFISGLPRSIEGNVTASKPQTLEEATNIA